MIEGIFKDYELSKQKRWFGQSCIVCKKDVMYDCIITCFGTIWDKKADVWQTESCCSERCYNLIAFI